MKKILIFVAVILITPICKADNYFRIFELGRVNLQWDMSIEQVAEKISLYKNDLESHDVEATLDISNESRIVFKCEGTLDQTKDPFYEYHYTFYFSQDKLAKVVSVIDRVDVHPDIEHFVGTKKEMMDSKLKEIVNMHKLRYGDPGLSEMYMNGWATDSSIIIVKSCPVTNQIKIEYNPNV